MAKPTSRERHKQALLAHRLLGALVEAEETGALRAMLPAELGADDENEWLNRLSRLLPADSRVASARLRRSIVVPPVDAANALDRGLALPVSAWSPFASMLQRAPLCRSRNSC